MSDIYLDDAHRQVIDQARAFAQEHFTEESIKQWCKDQGIPASVGVAYYSSDLGRMGLPEELDGTPADLLSQALIIEELHRGAGASLPFLSHILSIRLLETLGATEHFDFVKNTLDTAGEIGFSEAITEPSAGTDTRSIVTTTTQRGDKLYLNGTKVFVSNGQFQPFILAAAKEEDPSRDNRKLTFWLFPRDLEGVGTYPIETIGQHMTPQASITFEDVVMEPEYVIGERGNGFEAMKSALGVGRLLISAASLGLAEAAMDDAIRHVTRRESFDKPLSGHYAIQEKLTDMEIKIRSMRSLIYDAAVKFDAGENATLDAALAKRMVPAAATEVASQAIQILGALGYARVSRVGRIWNDCRGNQIAQGTDEIMVRIASRRILDEYSQQR